jgi:hypothetical protein
LETRKVAGFKEGKMGRSVSGNVTDAVGIPVSGATVVAMSTATPTATASTTSGEGGGFAIDVSWSGSYKLTATKDGDSNLEVRNVAAVEQDTAVGEPVFSATQSA